MLQTRELRTTRRRWGILQNLTNFEFHSWGSVLSMCPCVCVTPEKCSIFFGFQMLPIFASVRSGWHVSVMSRPLSRPFQHKPPWHIVTNLGCDHQDPWPEALFQLGSCQNPGGTSMEERQCGLDGYITPYHVTMEAWTSHLRTAQVWVLGVLWESQRESDIWYDL